MGTKPIGSGVDFKPGQSGNPAGPKPMSPEAKAARKLTQAAFTELSCRYLFQNKDFTLEALKNPDTPILELMIGTAIVGSIQKKDLKSLTFFLDRLLGKARETIKVENEGENSIQLQEALAILRAMKEDK